MKSIKYPAGARNKNARRYRRHMMQYISDGALKRIEHFLWMLFIITMILLIKLITP